MCFTLFCPTFHNPLTKRQTIFSVCVWERRRQRQRDRERTLIILLTYPFLGHILENAAPCSLIPPYSKHKACCGEAPSSSKRPCSFRSPFNHSMCGRPTSNTHHNSNTFHAVFLYSFNSHWPLLSLIPCSSCPPPPPNSFRRFLTEWHITLSRHYSLFL